MPEKLCCLNTQLLLNFFCCYKDLHKVYICNITVNTNRLFLGVYKCKGNYVGGVLNMLAKINFVLEKKLALMLAMDIPHSLICDKLEISKHELEAYVKDEDFKRIVNVYKEEYAANQLENRMKENDVMLEYLVKRKLLNLSDILDRDLEFIHEQIINNKDMWEARDFINSLNALSSLANVIRQLLRDVSWVVNDSNRVKIEKEKLNFGSDEGESKITAEMMSQIKGMIREAIEERE